MPHFVPEREPQRLVAHQLDEPGADPDERLVHADGRGLDARVLIDEHVRHRREVERLGALVAQPVDLRVLLRPDADRRRERHQPLAAFVVEARNGLDDLGEARHRTQRGERAAVRGVLVGAWADAGEADGVVPRDFDVLGHWWNPL